MGHASKSKCLSLEPSRAFRPQPGVSGLGLQAIGIQDLVIVMLCPQLHVPFTKVVVLPQNQSTRNEVNREATISWHRIEPRSHLTWCRYLAEHQLEEVITDVVREVAPSTLDQRSPEFWSLG